MTERESGLYVIRTFANDVDASLAEAVLDANGIESIIVSDNAYGMTPFFNAVHPIRLMVKESDVDSALALIGD